MTDCWADWLLRRRFGGESAERPPDWIVDLEKVRDRVLDNAQLADGDVVLDVGAGDGLIAFGALERGAGRVIFADVSQDLLRHAEGLADEHGVRDRCEFVRAAAERLEGIDDGSVDIVTTRSVLIYVGDKRAAFAEFLRVLKPAGRLSIFEPINRFGSRFRTEESLWGFPLNGLQEVARKVNEVYEAIQPESDPMLDFDERDLVLMAEDAGFFPVELELHAEVTRFPAMPWSRFVSVAGNPKIPSLAEAMDRALTSDERERLERHLRPLVERGAGVGKWATAYLWAERP